LIILHLRLLDRDLPQQDRIPVPMFSVQPAPRFRQRLTATIGQR
jgi:hypothetical protein